MNSTIELKELVNDNEFIEVMSRAFSDLRADYELTLDSSNDKIKELKAMHVDLKNHLSDLASFSRNSSGTISGLRGTGKTHLMLLARHKLNSELWSKETKNNLCIYLNMKRLSLPPDYNQEIFNRAFSAFIYNELSSQLLTVLKSIQPTTFKEKIEELFNQKGRKLRNALEEIITNICFLKEISREGNEFLGNIGIGELENENFEKEISEFSASFGFSFQDLKPKIGIELNSNHSEENYEAKKKKSIYTQYLNVCSVRSHLISIIKMLGLNSITFYVDEWEKISGKINCQNYAAQFIDTVIDDPIFFWISIVPYRGGLHCLDNGADLQHQINLDESLILENSSLEKSACLDYFKEMIDKRLKYYFPNESYSYSMMINTEENFLLLVEASMGNTRDFGTMFLKCWSLYQTYRKSTLKPGRPFKYFSRQMIIEAIKDNGDIKLSNIESEHTVMKVWSDLIDFCVKKGYSHFAVEEKPRELECLREYEFSELIYHRLLHLRKTHIAAKENDLNNKLSIYAINYAVAYPLHAQERTISFIRDYKTIHDRVRRYIYYPSQIISKIRKSIGDIFSCSECQENIDLHKMKAAWETNSCPFCGGRIRKE